QPVTELYINDNNNVGTYNLVTGTPFEVVGSGSIDFADVDNDGDQDVLISGQNSSFVNITKLYENDGSGGFSEVINTPFDAVSGGTVLLLDIDGNNYQDVIVSGYSSSAPITKLYRNTDPATINENQLFDSGLYAFPNPTTGAVNIDLGAYYKEVEITVTNTLGQTVFYQKLNDEQLLSFNIDSDNGLYLVKISSGDKTTVLKVLKQ
ncbi:MAG TPA: T9SS type A sorting domain-containing protein, partial [Crocinitomix sp.]|nr:T9SS type A sorting domain-containing protein [Crocinitomix sp.]